MIDPEFLAQIRLFAGLLPEDREALAQKMYERRYRKGTVVFGEGEPGAAAYFVREGRVKVYRLTRDGQEQILGVFGSGQPFGLVAVLDGSPFPATAEVAEDARVWVLRREDLQQLLESQPALTDGVLKEVGGRLRKAHGRVHSLAAQSVRQRLAEYLFDLVREQRGDGAAGPVRVRLTMTHQELGAYLGASRETVTRSLADLRREDVVTMGPDDTITVDPDRLRLWMEP